MQEVPGPNILNDPAMDDDPMDDNASDIDNPDGGGRRGGDQLSEDDDYDEDYQEDDGPPAEFFPDDDEIDEIMEILIDQLVEQYGDDLDEAKYQGREVALGKPMQGDVAKFKVYVKDPKTGNVKKVNFGDKSMRIKKSNPKRRKSFRARHNCANPGPRTKARYWSCRKW